MKRLHRHPSIVLMAALALVLVLAVACAKAAPTPTPAAGVTPAAKATPTPTKAAEIPPPKNPSGTLVMAENVLTGSPGSMPGTTRQNARLFGAAESLFSPSGVDWGAPSLAESYQLSPDMKTVTIKLRKGVKLHPVGGDWGELTAADMAWVINTENPGLNPQSIGWSASILDSLFGRTPVSVVDDYTIKATFANFDVRWATYLINQEGQGGLNTSATSKKAFDAKGEAWMKLNYVGTGPFLVKEYAQDLSGTYEKVTYKHWRKDAQINQLKVLAVPEEATRVAMLQTGEADLAYISPKDLKYIKSLGYLELGTGAATQEGVMYTGNLWDDFNALTGQSLMETINLSGVYARDIPWVGNPWKPDDPNNPPGIDDMEQARLVRTALAMAVDRQAIIDHVLGGIGIPVHLTYMSVKNPNWQKKWEYPYDTKKAEELLDQAGYKRPGGATGTRFEIPLFVGPELGGGEGPGGEIGDAIAGFWEKIGVKTPVLKYAYVVFRPGLVGRTTVTPMVTSCDDGQEVYPWDWPKGIVQTTLSRGGFSCGFESPDIRKMYLAAAGEADLQKRIAITNQYADYMYKWALFPGYVAVPELRFAHPKSVKEWKMEQGNTFNHPENIVPVAR